MTQESEKKEESALTVKSGVILVLCASLVSYIVFTLMNHNTRITVVEIRMENIAKIESRLCEIDKKLEDMSNSISLHTGREKGKGP